MARTPIPGDPDFVPVAQRFARIKGDAARKAFERDVRRTHPNGWTCPGCGGGNTCACPGTAWSKS